MPLEASACRTVSVELIRIGAEVYARIPLPRASEDLASYGEPPQEAQSVEHEEPATLELRSRALVVGEIQQHDSGRRTLLIPLDVRSATFSNRDDQEGRLVVLGSESGMDTRYADLSRIPRVPVARAASVWIDSAPTATTRLARQGTVKLFLRFAGVDVLLSDVDVKTARHYIEFLEERQYSANTVRARVKGLASLWLFLGARHRFEHNPFHGLSRAWRGRMPKVAKRRFTTEEAVTLLSGRTRTTGERVLRIALGIALCTGARVTDIMQMDRACLKESEAATWWTVSGNKTDANARRIPVIEPAARALMRRWITMRHPTPEAFSDSFARYKRRLGLSQEVDFHSARRSVANDLERRGAVAVPAMRYLGHRPPGLTFGTYSQGGSDRQLLAIAKKLRPEPAIRECLERLEAEAADRVV